MLKLLQFKKSENTRVVWRDTYFLQNNFSNRVFTLGASCKLSQAIERFLKACLDTILRR